MKSISRRDFLKLGALTLSGLAVSRFQPDETDFEDIDLVRVAYHSVSVYEQPDDTSPIVRTWTRDDLIHIYETVEMDKPVFNPVWYRVFGGYMHRARLQKVRFQYNQVLEDLGGMRRVAEVTVPFTQPYRFTEREGWVPIYRMYYSTTHWISGIDSGPDGRAWYRVMDEGYRNREYFVPGSHLRLIPPSEMTCLSPEVLPHEKHIDVNLQIQTLFCYELDQEVYRADISSGVMGLYPTPTGRFFVALKLPSRDMHGSDRFASDENMLSGVPWTSFFTAKGHAFHGTFWHDNFGLPMSHGCINMRNEDARWLYRWTTPKADFASVSQETLDVRGLGTRVEIHF